jgi:hypothetical protein
VTTEGGWLADPDDETGELFKIALQKPYYRTGWQQGVLFGKLHWSIIV